MGCGSSSSADTNDSSHNRPSHRNDNDNHDNRRGTRDSEPSGDSDDDFVNEALNAHNDFRYCTKTQGDMSHVFDITTRQPPR